MSGGGKIQIVIVGVFFMGAWVAWAAIRVELVRRRDGPEVVYASIWEPVSRSKTHRVDSTASPVVVASEATKSGA